MISHFLLVFLLFHTISIVFILHFSHDLDVVRRFVFSFCLQEVSFLFMFEYICYDLFIYLHFFLHSFNNRCITFVF